MDQKQQQKALVEPLVDEQFHDLMIDGYFATRAKAGDRPIYGYPANHLPQASGSMEVTTSFLS